MKTDHLSETEIQQYIFDKTNCNNRIAEHIGVCDNCKAAVTTYQLLFSEIKQLPNPIFKFNLSALVLAQVPQKKPIFSWSDLFSYFMALILILAIVISGYLFRGYLTAILPPVFSSLLYQMATTAITITSFQILGIYKEYQRQTEILNIY